MSTDKILPVHVSMIMDGNGRWAKERGKERVYGHFEGVESVRACVEASIEAGVKYMSVFAFSEENWNRPQEEVLALMGLMVKAMANEMASLHSNGVRFVVIGNRERLSPEINATIDECMAMTSGNDTLTLIVFLSYSGKWDILQAAKKMAAEMISDQHRLSKSNEQMIVKDEERLHELIPHLLIDFKLAILEEDRKQTMQQLGLPEVLNNQQKTKEVMEHYKKLTDTLKELAKRAGDRVILKA